MTQETINKQEKTKGVMSLNQVVASIMNKRNDYSKHGRKRLLQFAIEGYREFGLYHIPFIEKEWLKVNADINTVALPDQTMEFVSVGVLINDKYCEFDKANNLTSNHSGNSYVYEKANRRLVLFTPYNYDEVLVIYKSSGINKNGTTLIPAHVFMALRAWVEWEDIDSIDSKAMNEKLRKKNNFLFHAKNMRDVENRFTTAQFLNAVRSGHGLTIKR